MSNPRRQPILLDSFEKEVKDCGGTVVIARAESRYESRIPVNEAVYNDSPADETLKCDLVSYILKHKREEGAHHAVHRGAKESLGPAHCTHGVESGAVQRLFGQDQS